MIKMIIDTIVWFTNELNDDSDFRAIVASVLALVLLKALVAAWERNRALVAEIKKARTKMGQAIGIE